MKDGLQSGVINAVGEKATSAAIVSGTTLTTGVSTALNYIPSVVGTLASIAGLILSCILIRNQLRNGKLLKLRIEILEDKSKNAL